MSAIIGQPGSSLVDASWAASDSIAQAGLDGERRTAGELDRCASVVGPTVLHDLAIPATGVRANIDHAVVSGRTVWLIDSKTWHPGFLWSFRSKSYRGLTPFPPAAKRTMPMARDAVGSYLSRHGQPDVDIRCLVVVWPSQPGRVHTWALRAHGAVVTDGPDLRRQAPTIFGDSKADPAIVEHLTPLVHGT